MEEPTINGIPFKLFLQILWGYKKNAELRDRAVPGEEVVALIKQVKGYEEFVYIQEEAGIATTVWQKNEWKTTGERQLLQKAESEKFNYNTDKIFDALYKKLPHLDKAFLRSLALNSYNAKNLEGLAIFGITEADLK